MGQKSQNNCSTSRSYQEVITQTRAKGKKEEEGKPLIDIVIGASGALLLLFLLVFGTEWA